VRPAQGPHGRSEAPRRPRGARASRGPLAPGIIVRIQTRDFGEQAAAEKESPRERTADSSELQRLDQELRTERRWRETAVSSLAALESVLANIDSGILLFDGGGRVLYANQALSALFDIPPERVARMNREQFLREVAALAEDPILDKLKTLTAGNHPTKDDFEIQQPKWLQIGCSVKPVMVSSGRGQLVIFTNITAEVDIADSRQRLALTDDLTGLSNRRAGEQAVAREVARVYRTGQPLSFALFDVDHFKRVNDTCGHPAGDRVLRAVGQLINGFLRGGDTAVRWGGEEFLAILADVGLEGAHATAERIRAAVANLNVEGVGTVTISAGVSEFERGESAEAALARADVKLYEAKAGGRNRIC
jgi:diguanylate cyclase (GGDEF)-like protein